MQSLDEIRKPIEAELVAFEKKFREDTRSSVLLLDKVTGYMVKKKGKQMRPLFVFFSAQLCGGITDATYRGASLVELLHSATLIHDDVVDNANQRRGFFSINALWKNKASVLVGDYLLAKGMLLALQNSDYQLLQIVSDAVQQMSEGELLQMEKARRMDISEDLYYRIIKQKTASLIASCCACGAASAGASAQEIENLKSIGEKIGIAFQIKDDIFDFGSDDVGKPRGLDIKEKKITLPLIYALSQAESGEKKRIINTIKKNHNDSDKIEQVVQFVHNKGGIDFAYAQMVRLKDEAFELLDHFSNHAAKQSLKDLINYCIERKK